MPKKRDRPYGADLTPVDSLDSLFGSAAAEFVSTKNSHYARLNVIHKITAGLASAMLQGARQSRDCISILNSAQGDKIKRK